MPIAITRRLAAAALALPIAAQAQTQPGAPIRLFRVVTTRGEVTMGFTPAELAAMGPGSEVERLARALAANGQITGWRYAVTRVADGSTQFATRERVAVMRQEGVMIEPYAAALPVAPPPAG
ncbi:hypothetical protein [Falsiroseomonas sp. HW251]|uniref:hypothetical protein n=1 Tax=Falsiroseomonas sp. HW251 TaxID=3390998 RepID=UPI003D313859